MTFSEFESARYGRIVSDFIERIRPPHHLRDKLDLGFRLKQQSVEIFEIRPLWSDPAKKIEAPVAKATYVRKHDVWRIFWQRADLKWHCYEPNPEVDSLEEFLEIVSTDTFACFFG